MIAKAPKFVHNAKWKAFFYLKPNSKPKSKQTYGFKSTSSAPYVPELKEFEGEFAKLVKNIQFGRSPNNFQKQLKQDENKIKAENRVFVKADKSTNYYKMEGNDYKKLVEKEVQKEYRKVNQEEIKNVESSQKAIVTKLELADRVFATTERQCFASLKDHKENFLNNPKVRLLNPTKSEVGKISKQILDRIISLVRSKSGLSQWKSTAEVVQWFKNIDRKKTKKFIQLDVINFYPSITEELLILAINWARQFCDISVEEEEIIIQSKNSLLFNEGKPWAKKGATNFDVGQGGYDSAECSELVGLFLLADLAKIDRLSPGIYRDDCLAVTNASPRQTEAIKKKMVEVFTRYGLGTTADANLKIVNFLDVTFNLENETFQPFLKPNNIPQYVHNRSNHPPSVLANIPASVNKRLSSISSDEKMFESAAPIYQEAIEKSGYSYQLKFDPLASETPPKKRNRKRKVLWFNPPYNQTVTTNVGKDFLSLIDKCFPTHHPLRKIFNRSNVKVSYSTTPNMEQIISGKNSKILTQKEEETRTCSCPKNKKNECPLDQKCLTDNLVYQAIVTLPNQETKTYVGQTSTDFKSRLSTHKHSFKNPNDNQTRLSKYVLEVKSQGIEPNVSWKIIDRGKSFSPVTGVCQLCVKEAFYILFKPELAQLNLRSEIFSPCLHKKSALLVKVNSRKRKSPGN